MDAGQLLTNKSESAYTIQSDQTAHESARMFDADKFRALLVFDAQGKLAGVLSEHDVVKGMSRFGPAVTEIAVAELCTARIISCSPHDSIVEVMQIMESNGIRHLPVIDGDRVLGIISILDVMNVWMRVTEEEVQRLQDLIPA